MMMTVISTIQVAHYTSQNMYIEWKAHNNFDSYQSLIYPHMLNNIPNFLASW